MLKINAIRLEINTNNGLYGTTVEFDSGLNIVQANNTSGKSTIFQAILYALGFEELIGSRGEKTMQSVLKDSVDDGNKTYQVIQSQVELEINNGQETITIKRSVINENRKSELIDVTFGPVILQKGDYEMKQMYVHHKGAASDMNYGFHSFLETFLGWKLPEVLDNNGNGTKLYLPLIAPAFIIEQKSGWSSFFATIPYYSVKNAEERVIEFLLNLDVFQNEQNKIGLNIRKKLLQDKWSILFEDFESLSEKASCEIVGLEAYPVIINDISTVYFRISRDERLILIPELIEELSDDLESLEQQVKTTVGENLEGNQKRLNDLNEALVRIGFRQQQLEEETFHEKEKYKQYLIQGKAVLEDLDKNKSAEKMLKLGGEIDASVAKSLCPTCGQDMHDSLLPPDVDQVPMQIADNINFLTSQHKMLEAFIKSQRSKIKEQENTLAEYANRLTQIRQEIRNIKRDLVTDERLPSEELIERKINLRRRIQYYVEFLERADILKNRLLKLSEEWEAIKTKESNSAGDFFSSLDRKKLDELQEIFLKLLRRFNYASKDQNSIKISVDKYLPVIEVKLPNEKAKTYDLRFDSSGSDHIRCMWAYYIALQETSMHKNGNHPNLLLFDEPQQQSASNTDFHEFLKYLSEGNNAQYLVFASFQNSQKDFEDATRGLKFKRIHPEGKFITALK
ncbi:AAA family ATPase [Pedobacter sp. GSP4]|uniref:AAA family ATPase n=1 Tax=Pedobacter sp. GSP4 TaxID=3453716 RepID=UPI003EEEAA51